MNQAITKNMGHLLTVVCIRPGYDSQDLLLTVKTDESCKELQAVSRSIQGRIGLAKYLGWRT
jgi:hypothetical protein